MNQQQLAAPCQLVCVQSLKGRAGGPICTGSLCMVVS